MKSVLLIGATGLVGSHCLEVLLDQKWVGMVTILTRNDPGIKHKKLVCEIVDFENIEKYKKRIKCDAMISTFGTTIKMAGYNKEIFYKWDVGIPLSVAAIAFENGCKHFLFVSAAGVSEKSPFFYSKCKGTMEKLSQKIGFPCVDIFQPSFLTGERKEKRTGEKIFSIIMPFLKILFIGPLKKYNPVEAKQVAHAIVKEAENPKPGVHRHTWKELKSQGRLLAN
ncbi:MAG: NAD-dependent epimerase/dehydratase family protein [Spirochaetia bacterium]|nr:NAD-dependent epimerase/dehydratase family protein [Spirochaetia bacterium]